MDIFTLQKQITLIPQIADKGTLLPTGCCIECTRVGDIYKYNHFWSHSQEAIRFIEKSVAKRSSPGLVHCPGSVQV